MHQFTDLYKRSNFLHHAYFFIGETDSVFSQLKDFLEDGIGIKTFGNPDFWTRRFSNMNIEEARLITESSDRKSFGGAKKIFVIQADFITEEAQNALLKVFEEPTDNTHFFIISPQDILLPTLRSRVQTINMKNDIPSQFIPSSILSMGMAERLSKVKEIVDGISDEEKTKQDAINFLDQIEKELYDRGVLVSSKALEVCNLSRVSLYDRGAPVKMILENLVLSI